MKKLLVAFSLLIMFYPYSIGIPQTRKVQPSGTIWKTLADFERYYYLGGLQEGTHELFAVKCLLLGTIRIRNEEKILLQELKLTEGQRNLLIHLIDKRLNEINIELFGKEAIANVMTKIYDDPANNFIPFHDIAKISVMKLQGKSEEEVRNELEILRKVTADLMRMK